MIRRRWRAVSASTGGTVLLGVILTTFVLTTTACAGRGVGEFCERTGDGFSASHSCATQCLSIWTFECKDGTKVRPKRCAGELHCMDGTCPPGQVCYRLNVDRSACIPDDICPEWRREGIPDPVTESDEDVARRLFKKPGGGTTKPVAPAQ